MRRNTVQLIVMVATVLGLTLGPVLVSEAAFLRPDGANATPTALVGGRSSGY